MNSKFPGGILEVPKYTTDDIHSITECCVYSLLSPSALAPFQLC